MKSRISFLLALVLGAAVLTPTAPPAHASDPGCLALVGPSGAPIVWTVGDSHTAGYTQHLRAMNPNSWRLRNCGRGGETTQAAVARFEDILENTSPELVPDVVVIAYGTNDVIHDRLLGLPGNTTPEILANLERLKQMFGRRGTSVVIATPFMGWPTPLPPGSPGEKLQTGLVELRKAVTRYKNPDTGDTLKPVVHFRIPVDADPSLYISSDDGIHGTTKGLRYMARKATTKIKKALRDRGQI